MKKATYPPFLSSLLFTTFNLLNLFGGPNIHKVFLTEFILPWIILSALTITIYLIIHLLVKERTHAELLTFVIVVLLTSYGHAQDYLSQQVFQQPVHGFLLSLWGLLLVLSVYSVTQGKNDLEPVVRYIRIVVGILLLFGIVGVTGSLLRGSSRATVDLAPPTAEQIAAQSTLEDPSPDIYYIILDGYARADILEEYYGYDNTAFIEALHERGFYVAEESRANYLMTFLSLASSLNMQHIDFLAEEVNPRSFGVIIPFKLVRDSKVLHTLDSLGYITIHLSSGWEGTKYNPNADLNYRFPGVSEHTFGAIIMRASILNPLYDSLVQNEARNRTLYNLQRLKEIPNHPEPTFAFAHLLVPHPPYVFGHDGGRPSDVPDEIPYLGQLSYTNTLVLDLVDTILEESDNPPIIILQADHGTLSTGKLEAGEVTDVLVRERAAILNAYYLPDGDENNLYPDITPVNTFRVVFNTAFDTDLPLLEDTTYISTYTYPYAFGVMEVSD